MNDSQSKSLAKIKDQAEGALGILNAALEELRWLAEQERAESDSISEYQPDSEQAQAAEAAAESLEEAASGLEDAANAIELAVVSMEQASG